MQEKGRITGAMSSSRRDGMGSSTKGDELDFALN